MKASKVLKRAMPVVALALIMTMLVLPAVAMTVAGGGSTTYLPYTEVPRQNAGHHLLGDAPQATDVTVMTNGSAFSVPLPTLPYTEREVPSGYLRDGQLLIY